MRSFMKIKHSRNGKITLSFTDIRKSCPSREFLTSQICLFSAIRQNKILSKISEFTVSFETVNFEKSQQMTTKALKITQVQS